MNFMKMLPVALLLSLPNAVVGHGYLKSPRSRNYVAYKSPWWPRKEDSPFPESDVQSLNTGGAAARCGKVSDRNYDTPKNNMDPPGTLPNQTQASYKEGSFVDFDVVLTIAHKGHFVYKACPIAPGEVATQACFDSNPLEFVSDNFYGAVPDANHPARAYLPPSDFPGIVKDTEDVPGDKYSHKYRLPTGLTGSNVLIQWHYVTANRGCSHEGYENYLWPPGYENQYPSTLCPPLTASGGGFAEQFWNCAEIEIIASDISPPTASTDPATRQTTTTSTSASRAITTSGATIATTSSLKQAGDACNLPNECVSGSCFDSICECRRDSHCEAGKICNIAGNGAEEYIFECIEVSKSAGEPCILPNQCSSGSCFESVCECRDDSHCLDGKVCDKNRARHVCTDRMKPTSTSIFSTKTPTALPTASPSLSSQPSLTPSANPSRYPSVSKWPTLHLSLNPSENPSMKPSMSSGPSEQVSEQPSLFDGATSQPSSNPSLRPSRTRQPSTKPSSAPSNAPGPYSAVVAAYYASWQWYDRNKLAAPQNIDFSKVDRVNFAFFQSNANGYIYGTDAWGDSNVLFGPQNWNPTPSLPKYCSWDRPSQKSCKHHNYEEGLIHLVHTAGAEIYPSLGGWTLSDTFPVIAKSATKRAIFANQCKELIRDYGFDGIDLDWEYPGYADHSGTPDDKANFNLLLDDIRLALDSLQSVTGKRYGLTAALPCGPNHMMNIDIPYVNTKLDELNVMSYDFGGSWSETTSVNAPLVYQGWGPKDFSVDDCVRNWVDEGGSREKINLGLSFYGRSFAGATGLNQSHQGADKANWSVDEGTPQYYNILEKLPNMISVRDELTKTQYAYFPTGGLVSFDNEISICEKTEYAIENNLNGFLIWELSGDMLEDLSTPLLDSINAKLNDPTMPCSSELQTTGTRSTNPNGGNFTVLASSTTSISLTCNRPVTCNTITATCGPDKPCPSGLCCSDWGYCGSSIDFCGGNCCQSGPCVDNGCR